MGHISLYSYNGRGQNTAVVDAGGKTSSMEYDAFGNPIAIIGPLGGTMACAYDLMCRMISATNASGGITNFGCNSFGLDSHLTKTRGNIFTTFYDGNGNVIKTADAKGNTLSKTVYNCLNHPSSSKTL